MVGRLGDIEIENVQNQRRQVVNDHRLKPYLEGNDVITKSVDKEGTNGRDAIERNRPPVHHKWVSGDLSTHDKKLQIQFYNEKMNLSRFGFGFKRTKRYLKLKHEVTKKKGKVLRPDSSPLAPGEQNEASSGDEVCLHTGGGATSSGGCTLYPKTQVWSTTNHLVVQLKIIHTPMVGGFLRRDSMLNKLGLKQRMHAMWRQGEEVVVYPPYVDYSSLPPFDGNASSTRASLPMGGPISTTSSITTGPRHKQLHGNFQFFRMDGHNEGVIWRSTTALLLNTL
ncbi:hypothetical protein E3N88_05346 [Mikania micrantha]|uniref:Uncharacterized protein n=1 Tax=Mikania micrantha TaxID=192012 RepID=A0A5N6PMV8_9ASTR|nr:hypothetical protein E3N88_05346 [Mikania micrantha]